MAVSAEPDVTTKRSRQKVHGQKVNDKRFKTEGSQAES